MRRADYVDGLRSVIEEFGVLRSEVVERRKHPRLVFDFAGRRREIVFPSSPSDQRGALNAKKWLQRQMRQWAQDEAPVREGLAASPAPAPSLNRIGIETMTDSMNSNDGAMFALEYNGRTIAAREAMLSLTDMWRAGGSVENREPFNWARKEGASFIDAVAVTHNLSDGQVMTTKRGRGGSTFAHWQVALAYAKYLSPEFHMWCNTVVRERMEGRRGGDAPREIGGDISAVLDLMAEQSYADKQFAIESRREIVSAAEGAKGAVLHHIKDYIRRPLVSLEAHVNALKGYVEQRFRALHERDCRIIEGQKTIADQIGRLIKSVDDRNDRDDVITMAAACYAVGVPVEEINRHLTAELSKHARLYFKAKKYGFRMNDTTSSGSPMLFAFAGIEPFFRDVGLAIVAKRRRARSTPLLAILPSRDQQPTA